MGTTKATFIAASVMINYTVGEISEVAGNFVLDSIRQMIVWLIVMFAVIICDLIAGVRKTYLMGDNIRLSKGLRDTGAKIATYFAFVVTMVMVGQATDLPEIPYYSIIGVWASEGFSILGNLLKPKGYNINISILISLLLKKFFNIDKEYSKDVITKTNDKSNNKTGNKRAKLLGKGKDVRNSSVSDSGDGGNNIDEHAL